MVERRARVVEGPCLHLLVQMRYRLYCIAETYIWPANASSQLGHHKRIHGLDDLICRGDHLLDDGLCWLDIVDGTGALARQEDSALVLLQRTQRHVVLHLFLCAHL